MLVETLSVLCLMEFGEDNNGANEAKRPHLQKCNTRTKACSVSVNKVLFSVAVCFSLL